MINADELSICKRRGHDAGFLGKDWTQCKWCGMWLREVRTIEERAEEPPKDQQSPLDRLIRERLQGDK